MTGERSTAGWLRWQRLASSLLLAPVILSVPLALSLYAVPQLREVYISVCEPENALRLLAGLLAIMALSMALFFGFLSSWVVMRRTGVGYGSTLVYSDAVLIKDDERIVSIRNLMATLCAAAPFAGLYFGVRAAARELRDNHATLNEAAGLLEAPIKASMDIDRLTAAMTATSLMIAAVGILTIVAFHVGGRLELSESVRARWRLLVPWVVVPRFTFPRPADWRGWVPFQWRWRMRTRMPKLVAAIALAMLLIMPIIQVNMPVMLNAIFSAIGPLATVGLALTTVVVMVVWVGNGSRRIGFPLMLLLMIVVLVWGGIRSLGTDTPDGIASRGTTRGPQSDDTQGSVSTSFERWLESRPDREDFANRKYPVFVVAAQGGGIYAAMAAADFLAKMQDRCDNFAQHVFAISSVSGGSLGTALFDSILAQKPATRSCSKASDARADHVARAHDIVGADHLSGTVAVTVPDMLITLGRLIAIELGAGWHPRAGWGRDIALECSFLVAYHHRLPGVSASPATACDKGPSKPAAGLGAVAFKGPWPVPGRIASPALVLNTTRSETGDRVAFAPFRLRPVGDGTLISFAELEWANVEATLIEAAVTSARFPAMMPAKIIPFEMPKGANAGTQGETRPASANGRWRNFVDGGYADSSGATTALEIYHELRKIIEKNDWAQNVDLRIVLLTDAPAIAGGEPIGDGLVHAISPLTTLFSVRGQMARRAISRAVDDVQTRTGTRAKVETCDDNTWAIRLVMLDQQSFALPLGWMMSKPTANLIERMTGEPRRFARAPTDQAEREPDPAKRAANILFNNSCTMYSMTELLAGKTEPIKQAPDKP